MDRLGVVDILLVVDNPRDAELTTRALKAHNLANHLITVEDGAEALDFVFGRGKYHERQVADRPRLVLLDLKLPKVDGLEVLRALKADERTRTVPVVIMTSSREGPDIKAAYALGANSYVVKPVDFEGFAQAVSQLGMYWLLLNQPPR